MRRVLVLRHAKAERLQPGGEDHDRVLTERGRTDAARIGAYLARHGLVPDRALVSTSARTRETWMLAAKALGKTPEVRFERRIYDADPETILNILQETAPGAATLLLIGHNPGVQELAMMLTASGDLDGRQRLKEDFPTAALAVISFAADDWRGVHPHGGRLEHFVSPKWLQTATD